MTRPTFNCVGAERATWQVVLWASVAACTFGGACAATAYLFLRSTRGRWLAILGLLFAHLGVAAFMAGALLYGVAQWPAPGRWRPLAPAPEPVARLEGPDCVYNGPAEVAVRTTTGRLFRLVQTNSAASWEAQERSSEGPDQSAHRCSARARGDGAGVSYPGPPRTPVQIQRIRLPGADCGGNAAVLLAEDGTLLQWGTYTCAIALMALLFAVAAVVFLLAIAAFSLTVFSTEGRIWRQKPMASDRATA